MVVYLVGHMYPHVPGVKVAFSQASGLTYLIKIATSHLLIDINIVRISQKYLCNKYC